MPKLQLVRTRLLIEADRRADRRARDLGVELRRLREDTGLRQAVVARAAGVSSGHLSRIEAGQTDASRRAISRVAAILGADFSERIFPSTGPRIRDRTQSAILEALLRILHPRWIPHLEVPIAGRVRGIIDLVLADDGADLLVATEIESALRRLEQQIRWSHEKAEGLAGTALAQAADSGRSVTISRLLVLRSTVATREIVRAHSATLEVEFPARTEDAYAALTGATAWPGLALLWARVDGNRTAILDRPPRGIEVGR
jgi:transcriptional regulator with XRE-family HTH domain